MILSMTGYGKAEADFLNKRISVEVKSLNSKQFDANIRMPLVYRDKEMEIRSKLYRIAERGKLDFTILVDSPEKMMSNRISRGVFDGYFEEIKEIAGINGIAEPADWFSTILKLPDSIKTKSSEITEDEWTVVCRTIDEAIERFVQFRAGEGKALENIFIEKIHNIGVLYKEIEKYEPERIEKVRSRIKEAFRSMEIACDENRFEQEMIFYIDRLDISEEKMRLANHLAYFSETMANEKSQGRKLGFIAQEIGREINTLGSKSNHAAMQKIVVQMKDELEQAKEQILNVL